MLKYEAHNVKDTGGILFAHDANNNVIAMLDYDCDYEVEVLDNTLCLCANV